MITRLDCKYTKYIQTNHHSNKIICHQNCE
nr:MAG TPA: hypothetical protein [Caudoviricetes sp.]